MPAHRYVMTFSFGLVHGLGFASALEARLPPRTVVGPLLGFNLGVELGQLAIVAIALPLLAAAARARRRSIPPNRPLRRRHAARRHRHEVADRARHEPLLSLS